VFVTTFLPWWREPRTTHTTLIIAGMQFTGWQLLVPLAAFVIVCLGISDSWIMDFEETSLMPNHSPEPTVVVAGRSVVAVHVASRRWLSFFR